MQRLATGTASRTRAQANTAGQSKSKRLWSRAVGRAEQKQSRAKAEQSIVDHRAEQSQNKGEGNPPVWLMVCALDDSFCISYST